MEEKSLDGKSEGEVVDLQKRRSSGDVIAVRERFYEGGDYESAEILSDVIDSRSTDPRQQRGSGITTSPIVPEADRVLPFTATIEDENKDT